MAFNGSRRSNVDGFHRILSITDVGTVDSDPLVKMEFETSI
jgi:hypothetical protein